MTFTRQQLKERARHQRLAQEQSIPAASRPSMSITIPVNGLTLSELDLDAVGKALRDILVLGRATHPDVLCADISVTLSSNDTP